MPEIHKAFWIGCERWSRRQEARRRTAEPSEAVVWMCPLMSKASRHHSTTDISSGCPNPPSGLRRQTSVRASMVDESGNRAGDTRPWRLSWSTNPTYLTHRWCRIRRNRSHHTVTSSRLKKTCRSAVVLVPQASQPRSANYTAHSTHREDRKAKWRAAEADVLPYEFRPVCRPSVRQAWRPTWPTFSQLPVIPHSGPHPCGRPTPGTPRGASGALGEAENEPPRPLWRSRPWDGFVQ